MSSHTLDFLLHYSYEPDQIGPHSLWLLIKYMIIIDVAKHLIVQRD